MEKPETHDIQGIILRGYFNLPAADYFILSINDSTAVKKWLKENIAHITPGNAKPTETAMNLAFTFEGMKKLGLDKQTLDGFPMEMEDGMTTRHKQQVMGDYGSSDPGNWQWGGKNNEAVHALLMLFGASESILNAFSEKNKSSLLSGGFSVLQKLDTTVLKERKEHFGFHDGIAQPTIKGLNRQDIPENTIAAGEFILGYKNEYDQYPESPLVNKDESGMLALSVSKEGIRDLGRNGSYLVFRQLVQDVSLFWKYMDESTRNGGEKTNEDGMVKLASKMVGRWPGGAPLVLSPEKDNHKLANSDHFGYRDADPEGMKCPFSSHVRRSNPRDSVDANRKTALQVANRHRILRRGRPYGVPLAESMKPVDLLNAKDTKGERGLHFICFNTDIGRQFEFIQNVWINSPKFDGRHDERDPVAGNHHNPSEIAEGIPSGKTSGTFSIQEEGLRKRYANVPEFVSTKGGAYFFMPGLKALTYLSLL